MVRVQFLATCEDPVDESVDNGGWGYGRRVAVPAHGARARPREELEDIHCNPDLCRRSIFSLLALYFLAWYAVNMIEPLMADVSVGENSSASSATTAVARVLVSWAERELSH